MKGEPDDPDNPHRKRPPVYETNQSRGDELLQIAKQTHMRVGVKLAQSEAIIDKVKTWMGYCFLAWTGITVDEVCMATETRGDKVYFWFEKKPGSQRLTAELQTLRAMNMALQKEVLHLKKKASHE